MGSFVSKQPNGKYCRFSTIVDTVTDFNMTEEDYINLCMKRAEEEARHTLKYNLKPFRKVKEYFCPNNDTVEHFNEFLKSVGDTEQLDKSKYDID
jgi:hypothetical protein